MYFYVFGLEQRVKKEDIKHFICKQFLLTDDLVEFSGKKKE